MTEPEDAEVVDGLPVLAEDAPAPVRSESAGELAVVGNRQVAALAAGSFIVGAASMALSHRRKTSKLMAAKRRTKRLPFGEVVGSNSFLVDVHLLRRD
ncbi:MAG: hypothetical protein WKF94_07830 [Solirubrobacteraceae bacterium]